MPTIKKPASSTNKNISISGDVKDSTVFIGDNNTVNQTIIQKFFNIFKSDSETLEHRNRRILLGHVENAWIKGVLDASLHGAALLDLGIKQDPEAVTKYPWAIKQESTDETLPSGTSMLEVFASIGMGRSLLILGAPGSGKTTMLLELARQLIARAREDITYPIPMVFNLASWTEKLSLADWLAQELNNLYSVPRKTAPDWVKGNKLLLLLDGLDEVRQESRAKCVEAINAFRKEHGLTSLAVCSRSQDYANLNAKLSFEGAIEVQPLTQEQIAEFFNRFGDEMAGIRQALEKDSALREMAETPLFLSIMMMAYRDKQDIDILISNNKNAQRRHLFGNYIERMFERTHSRNTPYKKQDILHWLSWLATKMIEHNQIPYFLDDMQPKWLDQKQKWIYALVVGVICGLVLILFHMLFDSLYFSLLAIELNLDNYNYRLFMPIIGNANSNYLLIGLVAGATFAFRGIKMAEDVKWEKNKLKSGLLNGLLIGALSGLIISGLTILIGILPSNTMADVVSIFFKGTIVLGPLGGLVGAVFGGFRTNAINHTISSKQRISSTVKNALSVFTIVWTSLVLFLIFWVGLLNTIQNGAPNVSSLRATPGMSLGFPFGLLGGMLFGGFAIIQHYSLRILVSGNKYLPFSLVPFLDHCVDLIFLRRVGGGYIFVHRLLMEHFAEMYVETPTPKGN